MSGCVGGAALDDVRRANGGLWRWVILVARAVEPLLPADLGQPDFDLPWEPGLTWYFSGGPHSSFGPGSPWGALDFVPPDDNVGCYVSEASVTAVATGLVVRTGFGQVMLDLDQDGYEQTGWGVLFFHLQDETHALQGTIANRDTHLGRASCDGGSATGAHLHIARKYNGVWLTPRDVPFQLGDYEVQMGAREYEGALISPGGRAASLRLPSAGGQRRDPLAGAQRRHRHAVGAAL